MSVKKKAILCLALLLDSFALLALAGLRPKTKMITVHPRALQTTCLAPFTIPATSGHEKQAKFPQTICYTDEYHIAAQLGWSLYNGPYCGGQYLDPPLVFSPDAKVHITGHQGFFSRRGTSVLEKNVVITHKKQRITTDKATVYRDRITNKLNVIDLWGNIRFREPNVLIIGKEGQYSIEKRAKWLKDILYRTSPLEQQVPPLSLSNQSVIPAHNITTLTAWGHAGRFFQDLPGIYHFSNVSFSTCPPIHPTWEVKASHIELNRQSGRGRATHARFLVKQVPIFYVPYFTFSIDKQRKTGFLWPSIGGSNKWGPYFLAPFYWNIAPNYDTIITTGVLTKRGIQFSDYSRYLTETGTGRFNVQILPHDRYFQDFQKSTAEKFQNSTSPVTQAELTRLLNASTTRKSAWWRDDSRYNAHWSSHIDINYASDDYYLSDFGNDLNEITANQLLQESDLFYNGENWNFTGRIQLYQTLHPIDEPQVLNQYRRLPQLTLNGYYPDQLFGLSFFIDNDLTHFEILNDPGTNNTKPIGNRFHAQPGLSLPLYWPYFYIEPRAQLALTGYQLFQTNDTHTPTAIHRVVPIIDVVSGIALDQEIEMFGHAFRQTLEPQIYYTYIPFRHQEKIPIFDTTVNTLTYDQLFNYNRFSGLDRIGDANQLSFGLSTRFIDSETGLEKIRVGVGEIVYFANRNVTLCQDKSCADNPTNHSNYQRLSPLSGMLNYTLNPQWQFSTNAIWNPVTKQLDNSTIGFHYQPDAKHIINWGYQFARSGDVLSGISTTAPSNNLKVTDFSFAWPIASEISVVGRWSQNWNHQHLQNLLYGVQYDTCCWAVRFVGGRAFTGIDTVNNNKFKYDNQFYVQFALKGLGNIGSGNPSGLLSSISGYSSQFGQEF